MRLSKISAACVAAIASLAAPCSAHAQTFRTVYAFAGGDNDGASPQDTLILSHGTLFGTTSRGGPSDAGAVIAFDLQSKQESVITTSMGSLPYTPLLAVGNALYGTTSAADNGQGNIFKVVPKTGATTQLYSFPRGPDLAYPGSLIEQGGNLYGVAPNGGATYDGSIFRYDPKTKTFSTLYSFTGGADGKGPVQIITRNGTLYGVASRGGAAGYGVVFALNIKTGTETTLYSFSGATDGQGPSGLVFHQGVLYGTANFGGASNEGTVFKMNAAMNAVTVIHDFAGGVAGCVPFGQPVFYRNRIYGAAASCGDTANQGVLYDIRLSNGKEDVLHTFSNGPDGVSPGGSLLLNKGVVYGTTSYGGPNNAGTIFEYTP